MNDDRPHPDWSRFGLVDIEHDHYLIEGEDQCAQCGLLLCPDTLAEVGCSADGHYWHLDGTTCFLHQTTGDDLTTTAIAAARLTPGDVVFHAHRADRIVQDVENIDGFGTWITWADGGRDSFPAGYRVFTVQP